MPQAVRAAATAVRHTIAAILRSMGNSLCVLTIEADSGDQVVVNLHTPTQQVWLASLKGGYHFSYENGTWQESRGRADFWTLLSEAVSYITKEPVKVTGPK